MSNLGYKLNYKLVYSSSFPIDSLTFYFVACLKPLRKDERDNGAR